MEDGRKDVADLAHLVGAHAEGRDRGVPSRRPLVYQSPLVSSGMTLRFNVTPAAAHRRFGLPTDQPERANIDEDQVVVGAASDNRHASGDQRLSENPGIVDHGGRIVPQEGPDARPGQPLWRR